MKHIFLLACLCLANALALNAQQVSLKTADMPSANTVIETAPVVYDSVGNINLGNTGGPQTWNFSNIPLEPFSDFTYYLDTANTPYTGLFPSANLCSVYEFSDSAEYSYYLSAPAEFSQTGYADPANNVKFGQPLKLFQLPFAYNNTFNQNVSISGQSEGLTVSGTAKTTVKADAFGTVTTPLGAFPALRVYRITEISVTVLFFNIVQRDTAWEFWTNQFKSPLLTYHRAYFSALGEESYDQYADMLVAQTVSAKEPATAGKLDLHIAPNPVSDRASVRFNLPTAGNAELIAFDATGKIVRQESLGYATPGEQSVDLDLSGAAPGTYYVVLQQRGKMLGIKAVVKG